MELTDLKSIWTKVVEKDTTSYSLEEKDIQKIISKKSNTLFSKIVRELKPKRWLMGIIGTLTVLASSVYLFDDDENYIFDDVFSRGEMAVFTLLLGILILILFVNIVHSYRQFKEFEKSATDLKSALQTSDKLLRRIQKLAIFSDVFAVPIIVGLFTFRKVFGDDPFVWDVRIAYVLFAIAASFLFIFLLSRAMQQRKFGKYITQAGQQLSDLEALEQK